MTNADKFKQIFGLYATELWSKTEEEFLAWLNSDFSQSDVPDTNVGDMISRQAAIDRFNVIRPVDPKKDEYTKGIDVGIAMCIVAVKDQPTIQPVATDTNVGDSSEMPNSSDCISRQAAIDALKGLPTWWADSGGYYGGAQPPMTALLDPEDAVSAIENLPSAKPEPCEDAVSRHRLLSDLKELIVAWEKYPVMAEQIKGVETAIGYVKTISSVTPKAEQPEIVRLSGTCEDWRSKT